MFDPMNQLQNLIVYKHKYILYVYVNIYIYVLYL